MENHSIHDRTCVALRRRTAWLVAIAGLFLACAAESPVGLAGRATSTISLGESNFSFSITPADHTVRVRFARVRAEGAESVSDFVERVFTTADARGATRLVLDLSAVTGGDSFLVVPLVRGIVARERFARRGGLIVIVGPRTFSPAQNTAAVLRRYAHPTFVGQPVI